MRTQAMSLMGKILKRQDGQILPWMALLVVLFLGMAGLTLDLGHAYVSYRELQASTDAAALAGAYAMSLSGATSASVKAAVSASSSVTGGTNVNINLPNAAVNTTLECLTTVTNEGIPCAASATGDNALQVVQTAVVPTYFIQALGAFGLKNLANTITLSSTATAAMRGATNEQYNVAIVVDTTASMGSSDTDANCGNTRIYCALQGVQTLLQSLSPCTAASIKSTCVSFDTVSLFTFPNVQANKVSNDTTCPTSNPPIPYYYTPVRGATWSAPTGSSATYQITGYLSNYSSTQAAGGSLNSSSALSIASGAGGGSCKGMQTPGGDGTYYAGAIYAAESALMAQQKLNSGSQNALVILSDGDASSGNITVTGTVQAAGTGTPKLTVAYPSTSNQCQQAIDAANFATSQGTTVYSVAYGASNSGCSTDTSGPLKGLSPCTAMLDMASSPADFYSDATASQNVGQCTSSANPSLTLNQIFQNIATSFTVARLIPNGST